MAAETNNQYVHSGVPETIEMIFNAQDRFDYLVSLRDSHPLSYAYMLELTLADDRYNWDTSIRSLAETPNDPPVSAKRLQEILRWYDTYSDDNIALNALLRSLPPHELRAVYASDEFKAQQTAHNAGNIAVAHTDVATHEGSAVVAPVSQTYEELVVATKVRFGIEGPSPRALARVYLDSLRQNPKAQIVFDPETFYSNALEDLRDALGQMPVDDIQLHATVDEEELMLARAHGLRFSAFDVRPFLDNGSMAHTLDDHGRVTGITIKNQHEYFGFTIQDYVKPAKEKWASIRQPHAASIHNGREIVVELLTKHVTSRKPEGTTSLDEEAIREIADSKDIHALLNNGNYDDIAEEDKECIISLLGAHDKDAYNECVIDLIASQFRAGFSVRYEARSETIHSGWPVFTELQNAIYIFNKNLPNGIKPCVLEIINVSEAIKQGDAIRHPVAWSSQYPNTSNKYIAIAA